MLMLPETDCIIQKKETKLTDHQSAVDLVSIDWKSIKRMPKQRIAW